MNNRKSIKFLRCAIGLCGLGMMAVSIYLTIHYYKAQFPKEISSGSFCDISRFWNCDHATFSTLSNIFGIPISLFGTAFGFIIFLGSLWRKDAIEKTNFLLALLNFLGCIALFFYSIFYLGGLCPGCVIYYMLSLIIVPLFFSMKILPQLNIPVLISYGFIFSALSMGAIFYNQTQFKDFNERLQKFVLQMRKSPAYEDIGEDFKFPLVKATKNFLDAPLRITIYSDFQCPFCMLLSKELHKVMARYKGKLNVRYAFFPLDASCNPYVTTSLHREACKAAILSYCARDNFSSIHDELYDAQNSLSSNWLKDKAKSLNLLECYEDPQNLDAVKSSIDTAQKFQINAVPTMIINGRKIAGLISAKALVALLDGFLEDA